MTTLRELERAATPGPWQPTRDGFGPYIAAASAAGPGYGSERVPDHYLVVSAELDDAEQTERNFALIAAARNALPLYFALEDATSALVAMVRGARDTTNDSEPWQALYRALAAIEAHRA